MSIIPAKSNFPMILAMVAAFGMGACDSRKQEKSTDIPRNPTPDAGKTTQPPQQAATKEQSNNRPPATATASRPPLPRPPKRPDLQKPSTREARPGEFNQQWESVYSLPAAERYDATRKLLKEWITIDPETTLQALDKIPRNQRAGMISSIAREWGKLEPEAAAGWALELPLGESERALAATVAGWSGVDRISALAYASTIEPGSYREEVLKAVVSNWNGSPREAAEWVGALDAGPAKNQAMQAVMSHWSRTSPSIAEAWVMQAPRGDLRDHAALGISRGILYRDPGKSLRYAMRIEDSGIQAMQVRSIINNYARTCISCHRSGAPGCLRQTVMAMPPGIVPDIQKSRVFDIVKRNLKTE